MFGASAISDKLDLPPDDSSFSLSSGSDWFVSWKLSKDSLCDSLQCTPFVSTASPKEDDIESPSRVLVQDSSS